MSKYHFNPKTGRVGKCRARAEACPFGGDETHAESAAAARAKYERVMTNKTLRSYSLEGVARVKTTKLSALMDVILLQKMIREKFISVSAHPDDSSLKVLTYSNLAQIKGRWNPATKQARGLIIRAQDEDLGDAVVLERPWKKFFTLSQIQSEDGSPGWALGDEEDNAHNTADNELANLDFTAAAEVTDKMDGSLGVLYEAPDGKLAFSTKGSFVSDQAIYYTKMLRDNESLYKAAESLKKENPNTTFLFELVGPENQVVLEYDRDEITFLGAVEKDTGLYRSTSDYPWEESGYSSAEVMKADNLSEALAIPARVNREGVVVRLKSNDPSKQMQIKIKQEDYLSLHRLMTGFSISEARRLIRASKATHKDLMNLAESGDPTCIPELRASLESLAKGKSNFHKRLYENNTTMLRNAIMPKAELYKKTYEGFVALPESTFSGDPRESKALFARSIASRSRDEKFLLFAFYDAKVGNRDPGLEPILMMMAHDLKDPKSVRE